MLLFIDPKNIYETETEESLSLRVPCDTETGMRYSCRSLHIDKSVVVNIYGISCNVNNYPLDAIAYC